MRDNRLRHLDLAKEEKVFSLDTFDLDTFTSWLQQAGDFTLLKKRIE